MENFTHLHVHSQYSILDGAASINALVEKAKSFNMTALALTDHGNLLGAKEFHEKCKKNGIKPIIGCETYVARRGMLIKKERIDQSGHHLILLAKNITGYYNLVNMISRANLEGFYNRARIDKELLKEYSEGLIVSSACLGGEVSQHIMNDRMDEADDTIRWFKDVFGEDYYLEVMYHPCEDPKLRANVPENQIRVNEKIFELAKKHNVKVIATNDVHFAGEDDARAHDVLVCLTTNADINSEDRLRYTRQEWFKSQDEMGALFPNHPEVFENTMEIADEIEQYELDKAPIMPEFPIPEDFGKIDDWREKFSEEVLLEEFSKDRFLALGGYESVLRIKFESDYLNHLVAEGAKQRYGDNLSPEINERIDFELDTIKRMGFPSYFLIVQDFIAFGRSKGVLIGKGRGSAAGSVVAYCTKITDVDPIKFDLLFERFLNPDRISMPDVDIDFDDDGRALVIDYVTRKYGQDKVAHICTIGTMKAKGALKDVCRILGVPLDRVNALTKKIDANGSLSNAYNIITETENKLGSLEKTIEEITKQYYTAKKEEKDKDAIVLDTRKILAEEMLESRKLGDNLMPEAISIACTLEGSVRQTGVHACGILIGRDSLNQNIPLMRTKDNPEMPSTQFEGKFVEAIGLLKMDFLGLRTLSIIKESLENIKLSRGKEIDIDGIVLDDVKTLEVFRQGATTSIFQFESDGMKSHLRALKPTEFNDLVAMNALYRPGPMEYIPNYVKRKHGLEQISYDHPLMEKFLKNTYGITVFQEQVMLQSRELANFTRGESDTLRKAMGKKQIDTMNKLKEKFILGCKENPNFVQGCEQTNKNEDDVINKIWDDWAKFAKYAFNKSHSVCYAYIAYQTAYLKAHYPAEFMAANLTRNISDMEKISIQMSECKRMKINVLSPDVNESYRHFTVNKKGDIRFGLAGIKNVGSNAVENIIEERRKNGNYKDIFDFVSRVNLNAVNKKNIEALAYAGALDCFKEITRQHIFIDQGNESFVETLIRFGNNVQQSANAGMTLFGDSLDYEITNPPIPAVAEYDALKFLNQEKEFIGMYLSGHPLDPYKFIITNMRLTPLREMQAMAENPKIGQNQFAGFITSVVEKTSKTGNPWGEITLTDYTGSYSFKQYGKGYAQYKNYFVKGYPILVNFSFKQTSYGEKRIIFSINSVKLLSDVQDNYFSKITLIVSINNITDKFVAELDKTTNKNKGDVLLNLIIFNPNDNSQINLFSRTKRIALTQDVIDFFDNNPCIDEVNIK